MPSLSQPPANIEQRLIRGAASFGVALTAAAAACLLQLLDELERWNRTYNLTAIRNREDMLTHHLLDSLSVDPLLQGATVADVGTGAGFPGLPLAVVNPERRFTLVDSNGKKTRFIEHAVRELQLQNVVAVHARVEKLEPATPFDTVVARAFSSLSDLVAKVGRLCGPDSRLLAMKGQWPQAEIEALPAQWRVQSSHELIVPGLAAARCAIVLMQR